MSVILHTPRVTLRELEESDLDVVAAMLTDTEVMRYWPAPFTRAEAAAWIARQRERYARDGCGYWLALDRETGAPIGQVGLMRVEIEGVPDLGLGYILARAYWGRGLAQEAAAACCEKAFAAGAPHVIALIRPENAPSIALAERLGMEPGRSVLFAGLHHVVYTARPAALGGKEEAPSWESA